MSRMTITVPGEIYQRMQAIARAKGTTVEQIATKALERGLARHWSEGREIAGAGR